MEEIWKPLVSIPQVIGQFEISNLGHIRRIAAFNTQQKSAPVEKACRIMGNGYLYAQFWYDGTNHPKRLHRLVAIHFVPNPNNYDQVNHIDGDKLNNCCTNLEWTTCSENNRHKFRTLGTKPHRWTDEERKQIGERSKAAYQRSLQPGYVSTSYYSTHKEQIKENRQFAKKKNQKES